MSLKAFHILFVTVSTMLSVLFGVWALRQFMTSQSPGLLVAAIGAMAFAVLLIGYGAWFLRKLKDVSFF